VPARRAPPQPAAGAQAQDAALARRRMAEETAAAQRAQIAEKAQRDAEQRAAARNRIEPSFFAQFGTSHR
jgi:hypothetical protein